jgi:hypothetical protein
MSLKTTGFPIYLLQPFIGDIHGLQNSKTGELVKRGLKNQPLNQRVKQHLKRLATKLEEENKSYQESLQEIRAKYIVEDKIPDDKKEDFIKEVTSLNETVIDIPHHTFTEEDLNIPDCVEDYDILDYILPLVDEPEEVEAD